MPVYEGLGCHWLVTPEGILGWTPPEWDDEDQSSFVLRLIDFRAPELPVVALGEAPVRPLAMFVGPRSSTFAVAVDAAGQRRDRVLSLPSGASV